MSIINVQHLVNRSPGFRAYLEEQRAAYESQLRARIADEWAKLIVDGWAGPI